MNKSIRKILLFTVLFLSAHCSSVPRQLGIRNVPTEELCPYTLYNKDANDCKPTQGFWQKAHEITYSEFLIDPNDIHNQDIKEDVKKLKEESHKIDRTGIFEKLAKKVWSNYIYQVINKSERSRNLFSEQLEYRSCHSSHYDEFTKYARISQHPKSISLSQIYKKKIITSLSADFENTLKTEDKTLDKKHLAELSSIFRIQIDNELDEQSTTKAELLYIEIGTQT
ncbi:MAG: hypothetical protein KDK45_08695, partial [Leptospiraceae bacterium]|nr:hypothetical protein [Leptospiraceae bacterium]